jgi:hypothetical protein
MRSLPSFKTLALAGILAVLVAVTAGAVTAATQGTDVSGPCDEAEHANDPECAGPLIPEDDGTPTPGDDDNRGGDRNDRFDSGLDISGPCDEAEHANDPRCTGDAVDGDNSGPGNGHDDDGDFDDNSGPGNGGDDDDDGHDDDNSGPGSGDDDDGGDDSSGPGGGDDD